MSTVGERLREAIDRTMDGNVNAFHRAMKERLEGGEIQGYTYPTIHSYLRGESKPRIDFLAHAADVFSCRLAWLAAGDGPYSETEAAIEQEVGEETYTVGDAVWDAFNQGCGFDVPERMKPLIWTIWVHAFITSGAEDDDVFAYRLGAALASPLLWFDVEAEALGQEELEAYLMAALPGLLAAARHYRPTEEES